MPSHSPRPDGCGAAPIRPPVLLARPHRAQNAGRRRPRLRGLPQPASPAARPEVHQLPPVEQPTRPSWVPRIEAASSPAPPRATQRSSSMVRSPPEEEGEDAGTGSGSWPRTRRYGVGDEVEVLFTGRGFRGARFEATVTARLRGSDRYKVVYSELLECRGGPPLQEVVAACDVRPRPPPAPGHEFELFDLVEAYHDDGWWPGVVSGIRPKRRRHQKMFAVTFPLFRQVVEFSASFVRPRREFVYGSWIDAQEVLRGIPQYAEGSHVEVMQDKQGRVWRPAIIKKMVGNTNYVVRYGNGESSIEVVHTRFIRPGPIYDKMKLECELKPSAEVEVYHDDSVIADVGSCEPRRYRVNIKEHSNAYENDYMTVSSACLRPNAKWDSPEWRICSTKKCARKRNYSDSGCSLEFSTPGGNSDQYSSIPNKRVRLENAQTEEVYSRHSLNLRLKKLDITKGEEQILEANAVEKLICTPCGGKGRHSLPKAHANKRKDLSVSSLDDVIEIGSKYNVSDVVVISDDSSHGSFIEISDDSSYNPIKMRRRMNLPDDELHSNHLLHNNQAPHSLSRLWQAQNFEGNLLCIEAPNDNKIDTENKKTGISPEEVSAFLIGEFEPPSSEQKCFNADLMCIEARNDNKVETKGERLGMSLVSAEGFHLETCRNSAIVSYTECNASSQQPWGQPLEPVSEKSAGPSLLLHPGVMADISALMPLAVPNSSNLSPVFSTTSLLLMPNKMEVFEKLPQNPHFRKAWNCPPELRGGRAIGLMVSFADMAESIKNMRIEDEPRLYDEKMRILLDMEEEDGFEAGPLKVRLHNLLCTRTCQINLKGSKIRVEKEIFEIEAINCGLEQKLKVLDMLAIGMEQKKYQDMKASLDMQKTENCSSISKLQVDVSG